MLAYGQNTHSSNSAQPENRLLTRFGVGEAHISVYLLDSEARVPLLVGVLAPLIDRDPCTGWSDTGGCGVVDGAT